MSAWRHARAIALLPGTVTVGVPVIVLLVIDGPKIGWGLGNVLAALPVVVGLGLMATGLALWAWTVRLLAQIGRGTLAPWDPTSHLVVAGPYRYMRNPMITGVVAILLGEAALFGSLALLAGATAFFAIAHVGFLVYEEPDLERRFGDEYREYKSGVPRWLPRRTPWTSAR